jgi:hypothetical protein
MLGNVEHGTEVSREEEVALKLSEMAQRARAAAKHRQHIPGETMKIVTINVPAALLPAIEDILATGLVAPSRSEFIRQAILHYLLEVIPKILALAPSP